MEKDTPKPFVENVTNPYKKPSDIAIWASQMTGNNIKSLKQVPQITAKWPEGTKTASHQESLQNLSKSTLCAHTLHMC